MFPVILSSSLMMMANHIVVSGEPITMAMAGRAFSCAGPSLWNALPLRLRTQQDSNHFRRDLKIHLFNVAFW